MKALFKATKGDIVAPKKKSGVFFSEEIEECRQGLEEDFVSPVLVVSWRGDSSLQFGVGQALRADLSHSQIEAPCIVHVFAVVKTEHLLIKRRVYTYPRS